MGARASPNFAKFLKLHKGECLVGSNACFKCGKLTIMQGNIGVGIQGSKAKVVKHKHPQNLICFVFFMATKKWRKSPDVVIVMLKECDFDAYAHLDLGASLSFSTPFFDNSFHACPKILVEPFEVTTPFGESIAAQRVYIGCPMSIMYKIILCDLVELSMVDFGVILGMDWLYASYTSIDCQTRSVKFQFPNEPTLVEGWLFLITPKLHLSIKL